MKALLIVSLLGIAVGLGACGQKKPDSTMKVTRGTPGNPGAAAANVGSNPNSNPGSWTSVQGYTDQQVSDFIGQVPFQTGQFSGCTTANGYPCQVDFNVAVNPDAGQFMPIQLNINNQTGQYMPTTTGVLTVAIYDSLTGQNGTSAIGSPSVLVTGANSYMNYSSSGQGQVMLTFANSQGQVFLAGNVSGQTFQGQIGFNYSGGNELLGQFSTNLCYIFQCN